jgi:hypothetical protein
VVPLFTNGCGSGLHLHNTTDEQLARKASDAFKAADVGKFIESERKVLAATNERDLAMTKRNVLAERDAAILVAIDEGRTVKSLLDTINGRLIELGIPKDDAQRKRIYRIPQERQSAIVSRNQYLIAASKKKIASPGFPPSGADEQVANDSQDPNIMALFRQYKVDSENYWKDLEFLKGQKEGLLAALNEAIEEGQTLQKQLGQEIKTSKADLQDLLKTYKAEATNPKADVESIRVRIDEALDNFDAIAKKFEANAKKAGLEDLLAQVQLEKFKEARDQVGEFLASFVQENTAGSPTAGDMRSNADLAGRSAAILTRATTTILESSIHAKLVPLVFEQEHLRLKTERAQRAVDRGQQRLTLLERQRDEMIGEALKLIDAVKSLTESCLVATGCNPEKTKVESQIADANTKGAVIHALFIWAESIAINKYRQEVTKVALIALDHQQALDASEFALDLWRHMIASPLEELTAYHASGLKSEDIANLVHAAGLAGIAVGVNR